MFVHRRRLGEKILIPGLETEITIVAIQGTKVRIGISAPAGVVVRRQNNPELLIQAREADESSL